MRVVELERFRHSLEHVEGVMLLCLVCLLADPFVSEDMRAKG